MHRRNAKRAILRIAVLGCAIATVPGCASGFGERTALHVDPIVDKACGQGELVFPNAFDNDWRTTERGNEWAVRCQSSQK